MTDSKRRPNSRHVTRDERQTSGRRKGNSTGPTGTPRAGRRETARRRREEQTLFARLRTPLVAIGVIVVIVGVSAFVFTSAASPAYACTSVDTVKPAASGELGQIQPDMGNTHVGVGDKVTYAVCPPASGHHINQPGFGPIQAKVYGPSDQVVPNGWVHNLEHGGLVLLYSCDKGPCDDTVIAQLQAFWNGFPNSAVCGLAKGTVGPVVAPFKQMPTRFAALIWDRVLYLDTLDTGQIYSFFTRYAERVGSDGTWISPPEPQCTAPSPAASPSAAPSPAAS